MNNSTFAKSVKKKVASGLKNIVAIDSTNEKLYSHPTFCVNNLSEYIQLVTTISSLNKDLLYEKTVVFRGMSKASYDLNPGLSRIDALNPDTEKAMIDEFLTCRPDAFKGLTDFDIMAKMQHYGLPTRLLDFSLNPLVALYFACESHSKTRGRILCHNTYLRNDSSLLANSICTAAMRKDFDTYFIENYIDNDKLGVLSYLKESYYFGETAVIRPKYWNQRIANQAGVFMVFPNNIYDRYRYIFLNIKKQGYAKAKKEYARGKIDDEIVKKAYAIEPIKKYNQEDHFLSDEVFSQMYDSYTNNPNCRMTKEEIEHFFTNRFNISHTLKPLSQKIINDDFCSIIIEPNNKKKILKDLSYIGIGADYIYPELEYTAQEIRRKFE